MIESCLERTPTVIILAPTCKSDQLQVLRPGFPPQRPGDLIAAQVRHSNVEERHIWAKGLCQVQGGLTQMRDSHLVASKFEKH